MCWRFKARTLMPNIGYGSHKHTSTCWFLICNQLYCAESFDNVSSSKPSWKEWPGWSPVSTGWTAEEMNRQFTCTFPSCLNKTTKKKRKGKRKNKLEYPLFFLMKCFVVLGKNLIQNARQEHNSSPVPQPKIQEKVRITAGQSPGSRLSFIPLKSNIFSE